MRGLSISHQVGCAIGAALCAVLCFGEAAAQQSITILDPISVSAGTGEKPQSKVWQHADTWWTVAPSTSVAPSGTWIWRLENDNSWTNVLQISSEIGTHADAKALGDVTHILLHDASPELVSVEHVPGTNTYQLWTSRPTATPIALPGGETATIDVDSTGRMWLAADSGPVIRVYYSDSPYSSFSSSITLAGNVAGDDIAAVVALPNNTVGVLWSDQTTKRFGFRIHEDGTSPTVWLADEVPALDFVLDPDVGGGIADDHLNFATATDGTLYAAVKTSYETPGYVQLALLVRRLVGGGPSGVWDFYEIAESGSRPIVHLNEAADLLRVTYTAYGSPSKLKYRDSSIATIAFGPEKLLGPESVQNVTSTKQLWLDEMVFLASDGSTTQGALVNLNRNQVGFWEMNEGPGTTLVDSSDQSNHGATVGAPTWITGTTGLGLHTDGIADYALVPANASLDITSAITLAAWIKPESQSAQDIIKKATLGLDDGYEFALSPPEDPTSSGTLLFRLNEATSGDLYRVDTTTQYPFDGSTWVHVAATYDGATMRIFLNGVEEASIPGPPSIATNGLDLGIGAQSDSTRLFQGGLDDVRIYSRALSASEVARLSIRPPAPIRELVAYYKMNENGGTTLVDSSGLGLDGAMTGSPTWIAGFDDLAVEFDGALDHAVVPDDAALDIDSAITISTWLKPSSGGTQRILSKVDGSAGYELYLSSSGYLSFRLNNRNSQRVDSNYLFTSDLDSWVHIAATYDGATMRIYVDGIQDNTVATSDGIETNSGDLGIGARADGTSPLAGALDEVRIYNGALDPAAIGMLAVDLRCGNGILDEEEECDAGAANGNGSCCSITCTIQLAGSVCRGAADTCDTAEVCKTVGGAPPASGLSGQWNMEEDGGSILVDDSGLGNHGSISGAPTWAAGIDGLSLHQKGTPDYALVDHDTSLDMTTGVTLAAWIKPEKQATQALIHKANSSNDGYELALASASSGSVPGRVFVRFNNSSSGNSYRLSSETEYPYDGNTWIHVAATYDGTTARIYYNGVEEDAEAGPSAIATNALRLGIGGPSDEDVSKLFQGGMDQVLVYDRALSADEIANLVNVECPVDEFLPPATVCRASEDVCDVAETCTGSSASCPADGFESILTECRASTDVCDAAETCTGSSATCPADGFESAAVECRASVDTCDAVETCTGSSADCPADAFASASTECRSAVGACDAAELCTGSSTSCPADGFMAAGTECRSAVGTCDFAEFCSGAVATCPVDDFKLDGTTCENGSVCDGEEVCQGGSCDPGITLDCNDFDPCTADGCDDVTGCFHDLIQQCPVEIPASSGGGRMVLMVMLLAVAVLSLARKRAKGSTA
jgi:hypothetical protein